MQVDKLDLKPNYELEAIEENWQSEVKELLEVVNRLQEENKKLKESARSEKHAVVAEFAAQRHEAEEEEIKVLTKLKETVDKQREELRSMKRELSQKGVDCDALQAQLERIAKVNADLRRKNSTHKKQARALLEEKVDLETQLHTKDAEVEHIKKIMVEQEKYDEQRAAVKAVVEASKSIEEEEETRATCSDEPIQQQLVRATTTTSATETDHVLSPGSPGFDLEGKLVIDLKDPNRPRFTLHELRQVLMERNELKTRLIEVEDELAHYKPREDPSVLHDGRGNDDEKSSYTGEEVLVYGPINKEPDEKVGVKKESGIRKLFLRFLEAGFDALVGSDVDEEDEISELPMYSFWFFVFGWYGGQGWSEEEKHTEAIVGGTRSRAFQNFHTYTSSTMGQSYHAYRGGQSSDYSCGDDGHYIQPIHIGREYSNEDGFFNTDTFSRPLEDAFPVFSWDDLEL
ncbi:RILP-like protein 1 [Bulinus truncatus]|nr:RILP-like protein 1 [Bulinus truncatus]